MADPNTTNFNNFKVDTTEQGFRIVTPLNTPTVGGTVFSSWRKWG